MPQPRYSESPFESRELLKNAIAFMGTHQLSANPVNYTVCYEYLLGTRPSLKQAIDQAIQDDHILSDQLMEQWFKTHLSEYDLSHLQQSQSDLIEVISALSESARQAEENVSQFDQTLRHSEKALIDPNSSLESIVAHLLASTKSIQASMELMRQQMQDSQQEISALRTRLKKANEEVVTDSMTGLVNRKGLTNAIETALSSIEESKPYPCILMIDIDHFKNINDTYGHLLGDRVIKVVADTLKNQIKGKDTAARYGGEEFCILLTETQLADAVKVAENIRSTIEKTRIKRIKSQQEICRITISIGIAQYQPEESMTNLFERADNALYRSKNEGRNRINHSG